jgi:hypothetical protein
VTVNLDEEFGSGWSKWNPQAWLDFIVVKIMLRRVADVIPRTYVPILRLVSENADEVDDSYARVLARREPIRLLDSPRDKWRKSYGAYIRELEWVYGELRQHFPKHEYEELVVDIMARNMKDAMGPMLRKLQKPTPAESGVNSAQAPGRERSAAARSMAWLSRRLLRPVGQWLMDRLNPVNAIVGPVEMKVLPDGNLQMYIPRCYMHTAPSDGRTQDQTCLWGCKGACEKVFGPDTVAPMYFEPHLPDFSCTLTVGLRGEPTEQS